MVRTITEARDIIDRANQCLETVEWVFYPYSTITAGGKKTHYIRLTKNVERRDATNTKYWWPEIVYDGLKKNFLTWLREWAEKNKRDTLSKCVFNHDDFKRALKSEKVKRSISAAANQQVLF